MKKFLAIVVGLAILVGTVYFGARWQVKQQYESRIAALEAMAESAKEQEDTSIFEKKAAITGATLEAGLRDIGKLCTAEYYFTHVTNYESSKQYKGLKIPFTTSQFVFSYDGNVLAGVDFSRIIVDKNDAFKTITITLPAREIISSSVDPESFKLYDEQTNLFNPIKVEDVTGSYTELINDEEHKAIEGGLYDRARENAVILIENFLRGMDLSEYNVSVIDA